MPREKGVWIAWVHLPHVVELGPEVRIRLREVGFRLKGGHDWEELLFGEARMLQVDVRTEAGWNQGNRAALGNAFPQRNESGALGSASGGVLYVPIPSLPLS